MESRRVVVVVVAQAQSISREMRERKASREQPCQLDRIWLCSCCSILLTKFAASPPIHRSSPFRATTLWIFRFESLPIQQQCCNISSCS